MTLNRLNKINTRLSGMIKDAPFGLLSLMTFIWLHKDDFLIKLFVKPKLERHFHCTRFRMPQNRMWPSFGYVTKPYAAWPPVHALMDRQLSQDKTF